jgi:DNA-binding HxlR family transcriptional regulator
MRSYTAVCTLTNYHTMIDCIIRLAYSTEPFNVLLRKLSKKGFYEVLEFVSIDQESYYNEILKHCQSSKIVNSRSQVTVIVNGLTDLDLLQRRTADRRPVRTIYTTTDKGDRVLSALESIREEI